MKKKKISFYYLKYWYLILAAVALLVIQALCDLELPTYMQHIVNTLTDLSVSDKTGLILKYGGVMLAYAAAVTVCSVAVGYIAAALGSRASRDMRRDIFCKVSDFSAAEIDKFTVSSLITRSTNDITQIQNFSIMLIRMVIYAPIIAAGGIVKAINLTSNMSYMLWVIVAAVALVLISIIIMLAVVQPKFIKLQNLIDKLNGVAREGLNGMMVVRAFNTVSNEEQRFDDVNKELTSVNIFTNRVMAGLFPIVNIAMNGVSVAVVWIAAYFASDVTDVEEISVRNLPSAIEAKNIRGELEFDNVSFRYKGAEENVISNISFKCSPGETTAIIGATGSGKSTLIKLIPRLYDVTEGCIRLDGRDVREYTLESLRDNVAYVLQKNLLFSGTIESNIKFADEDAADGDDRMKRSAEIAQATEFISEKDDGFQSEIVQGGGNVSGGQKQRLSIARALYKNSPLLVFDDSFSALDFKTDAKLRAAIKSSEGGKNVLIVAQRVGTIMNADRIIVLDEGRIAGLGTHKELMKTCRVYADIARSQLSEEELKNE